MLERTFHETISLARARTCRGSRSNPPGRLILPAPGRHLVQVSAQEASIYTYVIRPPYRPAHRQSALTSSFEAPEILPEYRLVASLRSNERSASAMSLWASAWTWNL